MRTPGEILQMAIDDPKGYDPKSRTAKHEYMCFVLEDMEERGIISKEELEATLDSFRVILLRSGNVSLGGYLRKMPDINNFEEMCEAKMNFWKEIIAQNSGNKDCDAGVKTPADVVRMAIDNNCYTFDPCKRPNRTEQEFMCNAVVSMKFNGVISEIEQDNTLDAIKSSIKGIGTLEGYIQYEILGGAEIDYDKLPDQKREFWDAFIQNNK